MLNWYFFSTYIFTCALHFFVSTYIYIHTHTHIYIYIYIYIYIIYLYIYIYVYIYMYVYKLSFLYIYVDNRPQHKLSFTHPQIQTEQHTVKIHMGFQNSRNHAQSLLGYCQISPSLQQHHQRCLLCLTEKLSIISFENQKDLLNNRSELLSKCRHQNKFLLSNFHAED